MAKINPGGKAGKRKKKKPGEKKPKKKY